jgi:hypothetical protein
VTTIHAHQLSSDPGLPPAPLAVRVLGGTRCPVCWSDPGMTCGDSRGDLPGLHLARYAVAARAGRITRQAAAAVIASAGPVFTSHTLIRTGPTTTGTGRDASGARLGYGERVHVDYEDSGTFTHTDPGGRLLVRLDDGHQIVSCERRQVHRLTTPREPR